MLAFLYCFDLNQNNQPCRKNKNEQLKHCLKTVRNIINRLNKLTYDLLKRKVYNFIRKALIDWSILFLLKPFQYKKSQQNLRFFGPSYFETALVWRGTFTPCTPVNSDSPALRLTHSLLTLQDRSHTERRDARVSRNVEFLAYD